jgi:cytochrome c peroxidase
VAHENHGHSAVEPDSKNKDSNERTQEINRLYLNSVKSIFQKSCFDCHSSKTKSPWYSNLPGAKQLIARDVAEAKEHLDMSSDYPFQGHGTPEEDLIAIRKAALDGSMPPFRYRILHSSSQMSEAEKRRTIEWIDSSLKLLKP